MRIKKVLPTLNWNCSKFFPLQKGVGIFVVVSAGCQVNKYTPAFSLTGSWGGGKKLSYPGGDGGL